MTSQAGRCANLMLILEYPEFHTERAFKLLKRLNK